MFYYKDHISLNSKFSKSTNIVYDAENCKDYIITTSSKNVLKILFKQDYHNSISLIGPFGCGKSSLLLYINTLLSNNEYSKSCSEQLNISEPNIYNQLTAFTNNKKFLKIKIVGEHTSFKLQLKSSLLKIKELKTTNKYLNENSEYQLSKTLEYISNDIIKSTYTDVLFSIDEFGKFIEYSFENTNSNDIFDLQTLSEYINKSNNYKLIVSLHKAFNEYTQGSNSQISYSDWDKIQGRFENIVFKDDYYEMLNIFKETISLDNSTHIQKCRNTISDICTDNSFQEDINSSEFRSLFEKIIPIHPYTALAIAEIFTKYFQNQRSIYSFIFSSEPSAFQEFIFKKHDKYELYSLTELYDYIAYLLKVYSILLPDREIWYFSEYKLKDIRVKNQIQIDIIKTVALIHTFKLINTISPNKEHIVLSLMDKYSKKEILDNILLLEENNILIFQEQSKSFSLLEDSNIDINKEMKKILAHNVNIDYEMKLNSFISDKFLVAKRYFAKFGSKRVFEKKYVSKNTKVFTEAYKIFLVNEIDITKYANNNSKSIFIPLSKTTKLYELVDKVEALHIIRDNNKEKMSIDTKDIIDNMISDYTLTLENLLQENYQNTLIYYQNKSFKYSSQNIQVLLSNIAENNYPDTPMLNNYTLNHTLANSGTNTSNVKKLFENLLNNSDKEELGIDKYPAEKALYLSVIKPAGIHKIINDQYVLCKPSDLNFQPVWKYISKYLSKRNKVTDLIVELEQEPFGLARTNALFIVSLFIIINKDTINLFRDNTYKYELSLDLLMNIWKATDKYELEVINLTSAQKHLFKAYLQITTDLTDYTYTKDNVVSIIKTLYSKFDMLPKYAKNTQNISSEAIKLRRSLSSMKEPTEAFFDMFPKALGYTNIDSIDIDEFILKFKKAFNEIALSYKNETISIEKHIVKVFHLSNSSFPYNNGLTKLADKLSKVESFDSDTKAFIRCFTYSNSLIELIDNLCVILIRKKLSECFDSDVIVFKDKLSIYAEKMLSKLELIDIANEEQDVRKISLSSLESSLNKVISINKSKMDTINKDVLKIKDIIPDSYTNDEKLYLISQLLNEELKNE
ncbi:hypothetical protein KJ870_05365 [bacterium]|nr:hypothetical protein [bacterium]MBU1434347.1 hypothetical protein [bacterium]MBU1503738.1 hypothetical protein [bacterium]